MKIDLYYDRLATKIITIDKHAHDLEEMRALGKKIIYDYILYIRNI